eukprot:7384116-Prymnesium_polylepis.2
MTATTGMAQHRRPCKGPWSRTQRRRVQKRGVPRMQRRRMQRPVSGRSGGACNDLELESQRRHTTRGRGDEILSLGDDQVGVGFPLGLARV